MLLNTFVRLFVPVNIVFSFLFVLLLHYGHLAGAMLVIEHIGAIKVREKTDKKNKHSLLQAKYCSSPLRTTYCGRKMLNRFEENRQRSQIGLILL